MEATTALADSYKFADIIYLFSIFMVAKFDIKILNISKFDLQYFTRMIFIF